MIVAAVSMGIALLMYNHVRRSENAKGGDISRTIPDRGSSHTAEDDSTKRKNHHFHSLFKRMGSQSEKNDCFDIQSDAEIVRAHLLKLSEEAFDEANSFVFEDLSRALEKNQDCVRAQTLEQDESGDDRPGESLPDSSDVEGGDSPVEPLPDSSDVEGGDSPGQVALGSIAARRFELQKAHIESALSLPEEERLEAIASMEAYKATDGSP